MKKSGNMLAGLTTKSPPRTDKSMSPKGGSVNQDTTRTTTAPQPKELGPRTA